MSLHELLPRIAIFPLMLATTVPAIFGVPSEFHLAGLRIGLAAIPRIPGTRLVALKSGYEFTHHVIAWWCNWWRWGGAWSSSWKGWWLLRGLGDRRAHRNLLRLSSSGALRRILGHRSNDSTS